MNEIHTVARPEKWKSILESETNHFSYYSRNPYSVISTVVSCG